MNTHRNRVVPIVIGVAVGVFAVSMVMRFVLFSEYGIPTSYLLFGLPGAGIGLMVLLLRLGVFTGGQRVHDVVAPWQPYPQALAPTAAQHLQELDRLWQTGAISPADYAARRQQIISTI